MSSKMRLKLGFDLSILVQYSANTAVMWKLEASGAQTLRTGFTEKEL